MLDLFYHILLYYQQFIVLLFFSIALFLLLKKFIREYRIRTLYILLSILGFNIIYVILCKTISALVWSSMIRHISAPGLYIKNKYFSFDYFYYLRTLVYAFTLFYITLHISSKFKTIQKDKYALLLGSIILVIPLIILPERLFLSLKLVKWSIIAIDTSFISFPGLEILFKTGFYVFIENIIILLFLEKEFKISSLFLLIFYSILFFVFVNSEIILFNNYWDYRFSLIFLFIYTILLFITNRKELFIQHKKREINNFMIKNYWLILIAFSILFYFVLKKYFIIIFSLLVIEILYYIKNYYLLLYIEQKALINGKR